MRKESSVQQFITIREMERRQSQAHEEKKAAALQAEKQQEMNGWQAKAAVANSSAAVASPSVRAVSKGWW